MNREDELAQLTTLEQLPDGMLDCGASQLAHLLAGPTLIHLPGRMPRPLFVSVLLHGNEDTGFDAMREVLRRHQAVGLPRALSLFIGNIAAAAQGMRTLPSQTDYNRVWPGTPTSDRSEAAVMQQVVDQMRVRRPFASIDIHNNSGVNPHYACVNRLELPFLHLARLFSRVVVYFERPLGVQSSAMARLCPAVTVECGRSGAQSSVAHAAEFIDACLHLSRFPEHAISPYEIDLLQTVAIVKVPPHCSFSFDGSPAEICFRSDIDHLNFSPVPAGTSLGSIAAGSEVRLQVLPGGDFELREYFDYGHQEICLARSAVPAMLTTDPNAVRLDCLCYLMEHIAFDGRRVS